MNEQASLNEARVCINLPLFLVRACSLFLIMLPLLSEIECRILKGHRLLRAGDMRMTGSVWPENSGEGSSILQHFNKYHT